MSLKELRINWKLALGVVVGVVVIGLLGYFGWQYVKTQELLKNPTAKAIDETNSLLKKVRRHVLLPENEMPTIATVSDKSKLADQPFFDRAEEGDKVLIYVKDGRAILFRPKLNRVVEMTSVSQNTPTPVPQKTEATLTIWNGTKISGLASVAEAKILKELKNIKVAGKDNSLGNYPKTLIIVLNPGAANLGALVKDLVKAEVTDRMPGGESRPSTDLLLILGEDYK